MSTATHVSAANAECPVFWGKDGLRPGEPLGQRPAPTVLLVCCLSSPAPIIHFTTSQLSGLAASMATSMTITFARPGCSRMLRPAFHREGESSVGGRSRRGR